VRAGIAAVGVTVVVALLAAGLVRWYDPVNIATRKQEAEALTPWAIATAKVIMVSIGIASLAAAISFAKWSWIRAHLIHAKDALYPAHDGAIRIVNAPNEPRAQTVRAAFKDVDRVSSPVVKQLMGESETPLLSGAGDTLSPAVVADVDPNLRPHWLGVGSTRVGKSTSFFYILSHLQQRRSCEFVICEPGGVMWKDQVHAKDDLGIAHVIGVVYAEMVRRQEMLRLSEYDEIAKLPDAPPYLFLVVEEAETVLDNLSLMDRKQAKETSIQLRDIARLGGKPGVCLIAITQRASADCFDPHVFGNMGNVLLFRNENAITAERFRLSGVDLRQLPNGMAYSLKDARMVQFPVTPRPVLSLWPKLQPLQLAQPPAESALAPATPWLERLEPGRCPTPEQAQAMRDSYAIVPSKSAICREFYGYKDGVVFDYVCAALEGRL